MSSRAQHSWAWRSHRLIYEIAASAFGLLAMTTFLAADPIDTLIDQQKKADEAWSETEEELPLAYLWGDANGAEVYSGAAHQGKGNLLCEPLEFDELIEVSRGDPTEKETTLNTSIPRVREILEDACLIRPKDPFLAVGEGWQKRVYVRDFMVKKDRPICPQDSPYSLWVSFNDPLPQTPLFLSTDNDAPEGSNGFVEPSALKPFDMDAATKKNLKQTVEDWQDFSVTALVLNSTTSEKVMVLRRKIISSDDNDLPNEMVLSIQGADIEKVWVERVDAKEGTGHVSLRGVLDFNGDGRTDLVIIGDHSRCPYTKVFQGDPTGFKPIDLPVKPCVCK